VGFRRLGWRVLFIDEIAPELCVDDAGRPCKPEQSVNVRRLEIVFESLGLGDSYALNAGGEWFGMPRAQVLALLRGAALLLNVMGFVRDADLLAAAPRRVFLDIDPGFGQMWRALGLSDVFAGHDDFVTIGENIGQPGCNVPTCGLRWITTPQPIVLEEWPAQTAPGLAFTSIASWRGPFGPIEYAGKTYGLRVHEFRKFMELPVHTRERFELALDIHSADVRDLEALAENGWTVRDPVAAAGDPWRYRSTVQQSKAEFMVAKNLYVDTAGGWFSDRSICYLASGRPVLAQRTGWQYQEGRGLVGFSILDEAVEGAARITADYSDHARAAREIACEYFDSDKVLRKLLAKLGIE
jgi:hypothetical protein